jgi:hypothetical protein
LDFERGCQNAAAFSTILFGTETLHEGVGMAGMDDWRDMLEDESSGSFAQREDVSMAWSQFFDAHLAASTQTSAPAM